MHPTFQRLRHRARKAGSTATTIHGVLMFIKKHGLPKQISDTFIPSNKFRSFAITDPTLGSEAELISKKQNPKIRNWDSRSATTDATKHFTTMPINHGRYSSRCSYIRYTYSPMYHSELKIAKSSKEYAEFWQGGKLVKKLWAPSGLKFGWDDNGPLIVSKDGTEYHFDHSDLKAKNFAQNLRNKLSETRLARRKIKNAQKAQKLLDKELKRVRITLQDSRRAGNCLQGTINYLSQNGYDRRFIVSPLASVPAKNLDLKDPKVRAAAIAAYQRETLESI
jgi:hypothetical protein